MSSTTSTTSHNTQHTNKKSSISCPKTVTNAGSRKFTLIGTVLVVIMALGATTTAFASKLNKTSLRERLSLSDALQYLSYASSKQLVDRYYN